MLLGVAEEVVLEEIFDPLVQSCALGEGEEQLVELKGHSEFEVTRGEVREGDGNGLRV